ncbi:hypothetical protein [Nocardioides sp.]|nr:hypothetical protein [Nocardioides sp.]
MTGKLTSIMATTPAARRFGRLAPSQTRVSAMNPTPTGGHT